LSKTTLDGATIGLIVNPEFLGTETESEQQTTVVIRAAVAELEGRGATVIEVTLPDEIVKNLTGDAIPFYEARRELNAYFAEEDASFPAELAALTEPLDALTVSDLVASGQVGDVVAPLLGAADEITLPSADYDGLLAIRDDLQVAVAKFFADGEYDALVYPSLRQPGAPLGDAPPKKEAADLVGIIGYPAISVPAGVTSDGMPVGLELLGTPFTEAALLGYAYDYEQATHHRLPPTSVPALSSDEITLTPAEPGSPVGLIVTICALALLVVMAAVVIVLRRRNRTVS
jgi:amidase